MHFDRRLTGERRADLLADAADVRRALLDRRVDELAQERLHIAAHELRRNGGKGEGIAGETLDLESDGAELLDVRFQHRTLRRSTLEEERSQQLLRDRLVVLDAREVASE